MVSLFSLGTTKKRKTSTRKTTTRRKVVKAHRGVPRTIRVSKRKGKTYQTGKTNKAVDRRLTALKPGKRLSKNRNVYYETRKNRSDVNRRTRL